jgi:hypothetical protein
MRTLTHLLLVLTLCACAATPPVPATEEGKAFEAEQLVRVSLTDRIIASVEKNLTEQLSSFLMSKKLSAEQAEMMVNEELKVLIDVEHQRLVDAMVPIYRRYYTADEIHQLLSFYRTDVARKSLRVSSQIAAEGQQYVRLWNENFENELMERLNDRLSESGLSLNR